MSDVGMQEMVDAGTVAEVLTSFKSLHYAVTELETTQPSADIKTWIASVSPDFVFVASDFRRLLPSERVNLVGTVTVGDGTAGAGEGDAQTVGNLLSAAAWDELRERLNQAVSEKAAVEWRSATEIDQLKRKLAEAERRRLDLKKQLKRVVPNSSMYTGYNHY